MMDSLVSTTPILATLPSTSLIESCDFVVTGTDTGPSPPSGDDTGEGLALPPVQCFMCLKIPTEDETPSFLLSQKIETYEPLLCYLMGVSPEDMKNMGETSGGGELAQFLQKLQDVPPLCTSCFHILKQLYDLHQNMIGTQQRIQYQTGIARNVVRESVTTSNTCTTPQMYSSAEETWDPLKGLNPALQMIRHQILQNYKTAVLFPRQLSSDQIIYPDSPPSSTATSELLSFDDSVVTPISLEGASGVDPSSPPQGMVLLLTVNPNSTEFPQDPSQYSQLSSFDTSQLIPSSASSSSGEILLPIMLRPHPPSSTCTSSSSPLDQYSSLSCLDLQTTTITPDVQLFEEYPPPLTSTPTPTASSSSSSPSHTPSPPSPPKRFLRINSSQDQTQVTYITTKPPDSPSPSSPSSPLQNYLILSSPSQTPPPPISTSSTLTFHSVTPSPPPPPSSPQPCDVCSTPYPPSTLLSHLASHVGPSYTFHCPSCSSTFLTPFRLFTFHKNLNPPCPSFSPSTFLSAHLTCESCSLRSSSIHSFKLHLASHENLSLPLSPTLSTAPLIPCPLCPSSFHLRSSVLIHLQENHVYSNMSTSSPCDLCYKNLPSSHLESHLTSTHSIPPSHLLHCKLCPAKFTSLDALLNHLDRCSRLSLHHMSCHLCPFSPEGDTLDIIHLERHYFEEHQLGRTYMCGGCSTRFPTVQSCKAHALKCKSPSILPPNLHPLPSSPKPKKRVTFQISSPPTTTPSPQPSTPHHSKKKKKSKKSKKKKRDEERPPPPPPITRPELLMPPPPPPPPKKKASEQLFECGECQKMIYTKAGLRCHQLIHTGERPHTCTVCGQRFRHRSSLRSHQKAHQSLGEKFKPKGEQERNNKKPPRPPPPPPAAPSTAQEQRA